MYLIIQDCKCYDVTDEFDTAAIAPYVTVISDDFDTLEINPETYYMMSDLALDNITEVEVR